MDDSDLKLIESITNYAKDTYNGSLKYLKQNAFLKVFGPHVYERIVEYTKYLDDSDYSFSTRLHCFIQRIETRPICGYCKAPSEYIPSYGWKKYCNYKCSANSPDKIELRKSTCLEKYGSTNYLASEEGMGKIKKTNLLKYGVDNYTKTTEYSDRIKRGDIKRNPNGDAVSLTVKTNFFNTLKERFPKIINQFDIDEYIKHGAASYHDYEWMCVSCNHIFHRWLHNGMEPKCPKCNPVGSKMEIDIKCHLDNLKINYIYRDRDILDGYEIDIYIPDHKLGIELHGLYWHTDQHKDKNLHKIKSDLAESNGIRLIQIFEDEIKLKYDIVISRLSNLLGLNETKVFARKCDIREIRGSIKRDFLNSNHIQGDSNTSINLGLFHNDELVSLMTFGKERLALGNSTSNDGVYELNRFCSKLNTTVIGAAGKLMKHFIRNHNPIKLISYADRRWSNGKLYEKLGFEFIGNTTPNYWYTKNFIIREHRFGYRKNVLSKKLELFDDTLSESENMKNAGYSKIWDAGNKKYQLNFRI